jgi:hypothetical protein
MTAGDGEDDNSIDIEDVRRAMQEACRQHLEGYKPFPLELLPVLCSTYLIVEAYADKIGKRKMPGIRAAEFMDDLRKVLPDRSDAELKKMAAGHFGTTMDALTKALQRKPNAKAKRKAKRTKTR